MKKTLFVMALAAISSTAFAHDSTWKLCQGSSTLFNESEQIVVSLYEHRSETGRETDLTLLFGGYVLSGSFDSTKSDIGKVKLVQVDSFFSGEAKVNYVTNTLELNGTLDLGQKTKLKSVLKCKTLRD